MAASKYSLAVVRVLRSVLIAIVVSVCARAATPGFTDFEGFSDGTVLTTQAPGFVFSAAIVMTAGITLNEFEFPPHSGKNVVSDNGGPMTITFTSPTVRFSGYFTYRVPVTLRAFNIANNQVAVVTSHYSNNQAMSGAGGSLPNDFLQIASSGGIAKLVITGDTAGSSFALDDATASTQSTSSNPVPVGPVYATPDAVQMNYATNLDQGDAVFNITNAGANGASGSEGGPGNFCANLYVFDPAQEMLSCCTCLTTPDGLNSFSARNDLLNHLLTPSTPTSLVVKLIASVPGINPTTGAYDQCNAAGIPSTGYAPAVPMAGMRAWGTTQHASPSGQYVTLDNAFQSTPSSTSELIALTTSCGFIKTGGSGFGICNSCKTGGLAGASK